MPTVFLSAATVDLKPWRKLLHDVLTPAGFEVKTQGETLGASPGDVRRQLVDNIDQCDCVIHLAGLGYGSNAHEPFASHPSFVCSWTQFEYYYALSKRIDVIAFVCAPSLSLADWEAKEEGDDQERQRKWNSQEAHRQRVASGLLHDTPLESVVLRTLNEPEVIDTEQRFWKGIIAAVRRIQQDWGDSKTKLLATLEEQLDRLERIEGKVDQLLEQTKHSTTNPPTKLRLHQLPLVPEKFVGRTVELQTLQAVNPQGGSGHYWAAGHGRHWQNWLGDCVGSYLARPLSRCPNLA